MIPVGNFPRLSLFWFPLGFLERANNEQRYNTSERAATSNRDLITDSSSAQSAPSSLRRGNLPHPGDFSLRFVPDGRAKCNPRSRLTVHLAYWVGVAFVCAPLVASISWPFLPAVSVSRRHRLARKQKRGRAHPLRAAGVIVLQGNKL